MFVAVNSNFLVHVQNSTLEMLGGLGCFFIYSDSGKGVFNCGKLISIILRFQKAGALKSLNGGILP
jgi:hypothetical protein